jgi:phosphoenolpyruvate carboxykinase (GTP)
MVTKKIILTEENAKNIPKSCYSGDLIKLPKSVQEFIDEKAKLCMPDRIHICDGSEEEYEDMLKLLQDNGSLKRLDKMKNWLVIRYFISC